MADRSISVYLRAQVSDFKRAMDEAGKSTKGVGEAAANASKQGGAGLEYLANRASKTGVGLGLIAGQADNAGAKLKGAGDAGAGGFDNINRATTATGDGLEKFRNTLKRTSDDTTSALARMTKSAMEHKESWDKVGTQLTAFGAAAMAALGLAAKAAVDWESAWAGVAKTVDGTDHQLAQVEEGLRQLARTLPASHQEIAATAEAAGQLGVATGDIVSFTKTMIDLSETTNLSADEAATSIAQLMNVMQTAPEDVDNLGASLVALGNNGASTERDIIQMAQRIAGAGKIVGLTEGEVLGLANALASTGIEVEAGGSAISNIMIDIAKAVSAGGDDLAAWARVAGMSADEFAVAWKSDPADAIATLVEGLGRMNAAGGDVFATLSDLGQTDIRVTRALLSMANSNDLTRKSLELGNSAWKENTALAIEAAKRYDTTEAKLQIAKNSFTDAAISLGETFLPMIAGAAEAVSSFGQYLAGLPPQTQAAIATLTGLVGATSLVAGGFLLMFPRMVETAKALRDIGAISPGVAQKLGKIGATTIKGTSLATGLLLVASALNEIYMSSLKAVPSVEQMTQALLSAEGVSGAQEAFAGLSETFDDMKGAADRILDGGINKWADDNIGGFLGLSTATGKAREAFEQLGNSLAAVYATDPAQAEERFAAAMAETGRTREELLQLMPPYADALAAASNQQQMTGETATDASAGLTDLAQATAAADEELQNWIKDTAASDASFINILGAYDDLIQKNKDVAQATADSTESSKDSWETYYDGVTFSLDEYLAKLDEQVAAQQNWEQNLIMLSGRASQGVIDNLASLGPEGAPLVQALLDGTDEQLARFEAGIGQSFDNYTTAWATNLHDAAPVISAASAQLGADAAKEIAAKLSDGTTTIEDVIRDYGLVLGANPLEVPLDTELTLEQLAGILESIESSSGTLTMMGDTGPAGQSLADVTAQINETEGTVTIYGNDGAAIATLGGYKATVDSTTGAVSIQGSDAQGRATVVNLQNWTNAQGASIKVDADTTEATRKANALRNLLTGPANIPTMIARPNGGATGGAVSDIAGFASGGRIPGTPPADPMQDNLLAMVDGRTPIAVRSGEFIEPQPAVDYYGLDVMHAIRGRRIPKDVLQGYAVGGPLNNVSVGTRSQAPAALPVVVTAGTSGPSQAYFTDAQTERIALAIERKAGRVTATALADRDFGSRYQGRS